ncbi:unnamed protein product [Cuscuta campestris]|uniref:Uncharacterized protein n=1 Tax=Cuscuta campestris TaxID=132261 RepID=A0A484L9V4_9ASTE|nr:unnamed protein product [Cuscuta campestris]
MNAGLYVFSTIVLLCGFAAELSREPKSGLVLLLIALLLVAAVNLHDLLAHLAGINYRLWLFGYDLQLALVEFAAPLLHILGCICSFLGILFLFIEAEKGNNDHHDHAINLLIAGPALWVLGSILNSCQIYERAGGHLQLLQQGVHVPFLMASLLFLVASFLMSPDTPARHEHDGRPHHRLLGGTWVWLGIFGSLLLFVGGLANVVKVFNMQQRDDGGTTVMRLEKLRGGAQEQLLAMNLESDGRGGLPFIVREDDGEERWRKNRHSVEEGGQPAVSNPTPTPYKDVLVGQV